MGLSPHLPPRDLQREEQIKKKTFKLAQILGVVVVLIGAGFVGALVAGFIGKGNITIVERPTPVFVTEDAKSIVQSIDKNVLQGVLPVYTKRAASKVFLSSLYIDDRDLRGIALAITNDGWVVSTSDVLKNINAVIALPNGEFAKVEKIIQDPATSLVFAKVETDSLTPFAFARFDSSVLTEIAAVPTMQGPLRAMIINEVSNFNCANATCVVRDAGKYQALGLASPSYKGIEIGHPILNKHGEVLGIVSKLDPANNNIEFVAATIISPVLEELFVSQRILRPDLPFDYVDLSGVKSTDTEVAKAGALIMKIHYTAADDFVLLKDDRIIAVNGIAIDEKQALVPLLYSYPVGTTVQLQVEREDEEITIDLPLIAE